MNASNSKCHRLKDLLSLIEGQAKYSIFFRFLTIVPSTAQPGQSVLLLHLYSTTKKTDTNKDKTYKNGLD